MFISKAFESTCSSPNLAASPTGKNKQGTTQCLTHNLKLYMLHQEILDVMIWKPHPEWTGLDQPMNNIMLLLFYCQCMLYGAKLGLYKELANSRFSDHPISSMRIYMKDVQAFQP